MNRKGAYALAVKDMADGTARICRLYGVSPLLGRLYTTLFLSTEPMSLEELCGAVGAAKSSVSVALRKLEHARVARRLPPRNDRRDFYEAVTDPWSVLGEWTTRYFTPELDMFRETGAAIEKALGASDAPRGRDKAVLRERIVAFREFAEAFIAILERFNARADRTGRAARRIPIHVERAKS